MAGVTGLEPAASCVTGRRSNQAELHPRDICKFMMKTFALSPQTNVSKVYNKNYINFKDILFKYLVGGERLELPTLSV